mmetsp:Transcript_27527/g.56448  ORF Transcript_27527/g.56448 Transcript_27527/m.56448 type:complete len:233 (-) Transcript_27527:462-1160(-)
MARNRWRAVARSTTPITATCCRCCCCFCRLCLLLLLRFWLRKRPRVEEPLHFAGLVAALSGVLRRRVRQLNRTQLLQRLIALQVAVFVVRSSGRVCGVLIPASKQGEHLDAPLRQARAQTAHHSVHVGPCFRAELAEEGHRRHFLLFRTATTPSFPPVRNRHSPKKRHLHFQTPLPRLRRPRQPAPFVVRRCFASVVHAWFPRRGVYLVGVFCPPPAHLQGQPDGGPALEAV